MGFRFRRSIGLLPGVRINLGKRGISATIGIRGAGVTVGPRGAHLNLGLPGTGVSYRTRLDAPPRQPNEAPPAKSPQISESPRRTDVAPVAQIIEFKSVDVASLGSESLSRVGGLLDKLRRQRAVISLKVAQAEKDARQAKSMAARLAWFRRRTAPAALAAREEYAADCNERLELLKVIKDSLVLNVDFNIGDEAMKRFLEVVTAFDHVSRCARIWDVASAERVDRVRTRSAASQSLDMRPVNLSRVPDDVMATAFRPPLFINDNGADVLLYPAFIAARGVGSSALLDIREIDIHAESVSFVVTDGSVPPDAEVVGHTWRYVNKDGQPDRRFSENPTIPLARYCKIFFRGAGLNEAWMVSNAESGLAFGKAVVKYKASLKNSESDVDGMAPPSVEEWPDPELPERVPKPARDWKTPSVLCGGATTFAAAAVIIVVSMLNPPLMKSIPDLAGRFRASQPTVNVASKTGDANAAAASAMTRAEMVSLAPLGAAEVAELQQLLKKAGFDPGSADGSAALERVRH